MTPENDTPLTESTLYILLALEKGPRHGYAILKTVEDLSGGRIWLSTGTLYGAIKRLLDAAWIEREPDPLPNDTDRERKAYRLTNLGRSALLAEIYRLERLAFVARSVMDGKSV